MSAATAKAYQGACTTSSVFTLRVIFMMGKAMRTHHANTWILKEMGRKKRPARPEGNKQMMKSGITYRLYITTSELTKVRKNTRKRKKEIGSVLWGQRRLKQNGYFFLIYLQHFE